MQTTSFLGGCVSSEQTFQVPGSQPFTLGVFFSYLKVMTFSLENSAAQVPAVMLYNSSPHPSFIRTTIFRGNHLSFQVKSSTTFIDFQPPFWRLPLQYCLTLFTPASNLNWLPSTISNSCPNLREPA